MRIQGFWHRGGVDTSGRVLLGAGHGGSRPRVMCQRRCGMAQAAVQSDVAVDGSPSGQGIERRVRPPCYREVWQAPKPSKLIRDKRAFEEEHRYVVIDLNCVVNDGVL